MPPKDDRATARIGNTTNMHKQKNPQTDCATRSVNQNLVNYCTTVGTSCTTNPEQTAVVELQVYSRPTCNKLYVSNNDASTVVWCDPPARPSTSFVDNAIAWPNFQCDGDVPLFLEVGLPEFSYYTVWVMMSPVPKTISIRSSVSIELQLLTDGHRHRRAQSHGIYALVA